MDSVETAAEHSPRTRVGPTTGALISEVAARVADLARAVHDLERLVRTPEEPAGPEPMPGPRSRGPQDRGPQARPEPNGVADGADSADGGDSADGAAGNGRDEAGFSRFVEESNLTKREAEVLRHLLDGHSNRRISRSLRISESTVKNHLHAIFVKLDTRDRTQVVAKAYRFMADHCAQPNRARHPSQDPPDDGPRRRG